MLTLPSKFQDELNRPINTPSFLVSLAEAEGVLSNEQTLQADWSAASAYNQIDWVAQVGAVNLASAARPEQFLSLTYFPLKVPTRGTPYYGYAYQSFKQETGAAKTLTSVKGFFKVENTSGTNLQCKLFAADKITQIGTTVAAYLAATAGAEVTFDFSSQGLSIAHNTIYWVQFGGTASTTSCGYVAKAGLFANIDFYANGQMDVSTTIGQTTTNRSNVGDAYFQVNLAGGYYKTTGYLTTQTMDLGSTPTGNGEWIIEDIKPTGTTLTYQAWASATGAFAGEETNLGAIVDGTPITNLKRYYRVKATFGANGDQSLSPSIQSIKATFLEGSFRMFATHPDTGYEPVLMSVSSLSTSIDTFKASSIGQITLTLSLCDSVSTYIATKKPKNKTVKIKAGFIADGFTEADYIDYFWGQIDGWNITAKDEVVITVKDFSKEWGVDVPETTSAGVPATIWQGHPVDMMLDILKNHINVRDSKIDGTSFGSVKEALSGWYVFRTLVKDTVQGNELMEELRKITSTYYLPQATGQIKLKRWDAAEASVAAFTDADFITKRWDSSAKQIVNRVEHYYGWDGEGDDAGDYNHITIGTDPVSQIGWAEISSKEIKDKWTPATQTAQSADYTNKILLRYANPPSTLIVDVDLKHIALEVGDMVTVTTYRAPSTDMTGIANIKFQITNKNLNFTKNTLSLTLLESHSSVNTQVAPPVAQPTPYDFPDHVTDLAIIEQQHINYDGTYTPLVVVTYDLPTNSTYWSHALIQTSIDGGLTYKDYGIDYLEGNGFIIDASKVGGYVGGTFEVRAVSVNKQGIAAPTATAPTAGLAKVGEETVLVTPPADITGLKIEGASDPNSTVWEGLKFSIVWNPGNQTAGGLTNEQKPLGAGLTSDPYWKYDEVEIWTGGLLRHAIQTQALRYDYVYGDGQDAFLDALLVAATGTVTIKVRRWNDYNMVSGDRVLTITQVVPANPVVTGKAFIKGGWFEWTKNEEADFSGYRIRTKISTGAWSSWSSLTDNTYFRALTDAEVTLYGGNAIIYIEVKAVDLYGNESGAGASNVTAAFVDVAVVADGSITAPKIAGGAVGVTQLADAAITTIKLANLAVDNTKLAALAVDAAKLADSAVTAVKIANAAVGSAAIANLAVGTAHIADAAITNAKIEKWILGKSGVSFPVSPVDGESFYRTDLNITYRYSLSTTSWIAVDYIADAGRIVDGVITSVKIADAAISTAKIADAQITAAKIANATITTALIADAQITGAKIASATITTALIADAQITGAKIANATITTALIADAQITGAKIASATITDANISSLNADKITAGTITGRTLQTASSGKRFVVDVSTNEAHFYGDRGDGTVVELATIGIRVSGGDNIIGYFGSSSSTRIGVFATSNTAVGVYGSSTSNAGVYGVSDSSYGVSGSSNSNIGVYAYSGSGLPLKIVPSLTPTTNLVNGGIYYNSTTHKFMGYANGAWVAFH